MSDNTDNARRDPAPPTGSLPFFARFLEGQHGDDYPTTDGGLQASPARPMTLKYPSDRDEWEPFFDAPTDGGNTLQAAPERRTLKYPSDRDEEWGGPFLDN
jgi:hypothetical protein